MAQLQPSYKRRPLRWRLLIGVVLIVAMSWIALLDRKNTLATCSVPGVFSAIVYKKGDKAYVRIDSPDPKGQVAETLLGKYSPDVEIKCTPHEEGHGLTLVYGNSVRRWSW